MTIEVLDESGTGTLDVRRTQQLAAYVLEQLRVHPQAELCITAVDEDTIAELNGKWMEKDGPTDVLAFPMDELRPGMINEEPEEGVLGDLVLCPSIAAKQAEEAAAKGQTGYGVTDELELLTVHGILHLLGYDHAEPEEHAEMFGLQARLLISWQGHLGELSQQAQK
ncbi:putative rRNA maturation factor [Marmoricola sp. OAE513]|uniref:rRNA maturation RNase YbeY n=1 Tax=Marmoricola sp. OAE513 TaxID=2817894 RepID=UPI001AE3A8E1